MLTSERGQESRLTGLARLWPLIIVLGAVAGCPVAQAEETKTNFVFVDGAAVTLSPDSSGGFKFDVPVKNAGKDGAATVELVGDTQCISATLKPTSLDTLKMNIVEIKPFAISNIRLPATCYIELVSEGPDSNRSLKQVKLNQEYARSGVLEALGVCFGLSLSAALIGWIVTGECLTFQLGTPAWDFAKSWTSTTTLVGAIISTALALGALPELTKYASKSGYAILALLTSLVVVVAPFIFTVFRTGHVEKDSKTGVYSVVYQGCLWALLISCAMTLFAGLAQLVVFFLLLHEIFQGYWFWSYSTSMAPVSKNLGCILAFSLAFVLWAYSIYSIYLTIKLQRDANTLQNAAPANNQANIIVPAPPRKSPLLTWPVL